MPLSRRTFLRAGGLTTAVLTLAGCSAAGRELTRQQLPESLSTPDPQTGPGVDPVARFLNRAGFGPRPGDLDRARGMGLVALLDEQLNPESIEDTISDLLLRNLTYYPMEVGQLVAQEPRDAGFELFLATVARATLSRRQLYEAAVEFWSDHFNIYVRKNQHLVFLKIVDDREAIRPNALGKFRDLLSASAHSPAMLVYLDNVQNVSGAPNENYAREIMELHTLGVHAGYTQQDVQELARALTGWTVHRRGRLQGQFFFDPAHHDGGEKVILGTTLPAGQDESDVLQVLDMLVSHPATGQFIAAKLVRRFVADEPPATLVDRVAQTYAEADGDVKAMLRETFLSDEFVTAPPKLKRPFTFAVSAMRALGADMRPRATRSLHRWLNLMGQPLFQWPPPDGYPDVARAWTANLLPRWNFALALVNGQVEGVSVPLDQLLEASAATDTPSALNAFAGLILGRALDDQASTLFADYIGSGNLDDPPTRSRLNEAIALMLASPAFQWT